MNNNPVRYVDPSGHRPCGDGEEYDCSGNGQDPNADPHPHKPKPKPEYGDGLVGPPDLSCFNLSCWQDDPPLTYCGGGPNGFSDIFDCIATGAQDLALVIDIPFAGVEAFFIAIGCLEGPAGCAAGAMVGITFFNVTGGNALEMFLSVGSAIASIIADASANGVTHIGESSATAMAGAVAGFFSPDPIIDLAIDGYGSAYNHDLVNGVYSFVPFDSYPLVWK